VQLGLACIEGIYETGNELELIITLQDDQAPDKSGRVYLDDFARRHSVELLKVRHINDPQAIRRIESLDWLFIIGWSQIAGPEVLGAPREGVLGMHPTLLPTGRGRAAIPWTILKQLEVTGVTLFKLDSGVDTGPIVSQEVLPLSPDIDATELYQRVDEAHVALIRRVLPDLVAKRLSLVAQDDAKATVWPGRKPEDGRIDTNASVAEAERLVRAVTRPYPGAFFVDEDGAKTIVWRARVIDEQGDRPTLAFKDGLLELLEWEE